MDMFHWTFERPNYWLINQENVLKISTFLTDAASHEKHLTVETPGDFYYEGGY